MKTLMMLFFAILIVCLIVAFYIAIRNEKVGAFLLVLNDIGFKINQAYILSESYDPSDKQCEERRKYLERMWDSLNEIDYYTLLFSIKPLTFYNWLTEEQLRFVKLAMK